MWQPAILLSIPIICGCIFHYLHPLAGLGLLTASAWLYAGNSLRRILLLGICFSLWVMYLRLEADTLTLPAGTASLSGTVRSFAGISEKERFRLETAAWGMGIVDIRRSAIKLHPGMQVRIYGRERPVSRPRNPGGFNMSAYLASQNLHWAYQADSIRILGDVPLLWRITSSIRSHLEKTMEQVIDPAALPLVKAALLGTRTCLSEEMKEAFADSGMYHLLAISGLHVGMIALVIMNFFLLLRLPRKAAWCASLMVLVLYVPVAGASVSVVRAVLMFGAAAAAVVMEKPVLSLNSLALACCLCLFAMPWQILSLGFQLSFTATFFLLYAGRSLTDIIAGLNIRNRTFTGILSTIFISGLLFMATLPTLSHSMHQVSPLAVLGNVITIALTSLVVLTGVLAVGIAQAVPAAGEYMGEVCSLASGLLMWCVEFLSGFSWGRFHVASLTWVETILLFSGLLLFPFACRMKKTGVMLLVYLMLFSGSFACTSLFEAAVKPARVTFLDVDQGDAAVIQLPGRVAILMDAGNGTAVSGSGKFSILPFLKYSGINRLDRVVLSHLDLDHYGGLQYLIPRIKINQVVIGGPADSSRAWRQIRALLEAHSVSLTRTKCGDTLYSSGQLSLVVLSPCSEWEFSNKNDNSIVARLRLHQGDILFAGDIGQKAERQLSENPIQADILKISHHGSRTSSSIQFVQSVRPKVGILSVGAANRYGMPHSETIGRFNDQGVRLYSTADCGAVSLLSDISGQKWETALP